MATKKKQDSTSALVTVVKALEGLSDTDKQWVLNSAASRWTLTVQTQTSGGEGTGGGTGGGAPAGANTPDAQAAITKNDVRAFIRAKKPATDVQRVACLGAYLAQTTGKHGFTSKDISAAHTTSGGSKINLTRALDNATRQSKYISNLSGREKQLTPLGEDVVAALPDQQAVKDVEKDSKGRRGRKASKKTKKKA
jgi:hypothetical protein